MSRRPSVLSVGKSRGGGRRIAAVGGNDWVRRERKGGSGGGLAVYSVNGVMLPEGSLSRSSTQYEVSPFPTQR